MKNGEKQKCSCFAVIDTETTWSDVVMSIGIVIADCLTFKPVTCKYYIISPEYLRPAMYRDVLFVESVKVDLKSTRQNVLDNLVAILKKYNVNSIFAYNAYFDYNHLPELQNYLWFDIMKIAAYKQYNDKISANADCWGTGKLKRKCGVEPIMQMLSGNLRYREIHNALCDALDELKIMELLGHSYETYQTAQIGKKEPDRKRKAKSKSDQIAPQPKHVLAEGDKVFHSKHGKGVITKKKRFEGETYILTVVFEKTGKHELLSTRAEKCLKYISEQKEGRYNESYSTF